MYEEIKSLAREKRLSYNIKSDQISLSLIRKIYKTEGIKLTSPISTKWRFKKLRAAYFNDGYEAEVLINNKLPKEARIFSLIHELKHHFTDTGLLDGNMLSCSDISYNSQPIIEKLAEVFAAEFLFPEQEFLQTIKEYGITPQNIQPEFVVRYKKRLGNVPISYTFLKKRLEWFKFISRGAYDKIKFKNLEYDMFGKPFYLRKRSFPKFY